jgi:hypothetical protein
MAHSIEPVVSSTNTMSTASGKAASTTSSTVQASDPVAFPLTVTSLSDQSTTALPSTFTRGASVTVTVSSSTRPR